MRTRLDPFHIAPAIILSFLLIQCNCSWFGGGRVERSGLKKEQFRGKRQIVLFLVCFVYMPSFTADKGRSKHLTNITSCYIPMLQRKHKYNKNILVQLEKP